MNCLKYGLIISAQRYVFKCKIAIDLALKITAVIFKLKIPEAYLFKKIQHILNVKNYFTGHVHILYL
jgi:hypothetical protein